jgi:hypothetical protein
MIEALFSSIVRSVVGHAVLGVAWPALEFFDFVSSFDAVPECSNVIHSTSACNSLHVNSVQLLSDTLSEITVREVLEVGRLRYSVQRQPSGLLVATNLAPRFVCGADLSHIPEYRLRRIPKRP